MRPLLEFTREDTSAFCQEFQLPVWQDSTSEDVKYGRNRVQG